MKFDNFQYQRPEMESFEEEYNRYLDGFEAATTFEEQDKLFTKNQYPSAAIFHDV